MFFLAASIVLTSYLTLSFKVVERYRLNILQVIVFNYIACVVTGSLVNASFPIHPQNMQSAWFPWACLMGGVFILLFNVIGFSAQHIGVAITSVANKLSLVIPFLFSLYLYHEPGTVLKFTGIVIALAAVVLTCYRKKNTASAVEGGRNLLIALPLLLFIGSGLLDTMIKYVEVRFLNEANKDDFLISAFAMAAAIGVVCLIVQRMVFKVRFNPNTIIAGVAIGVPNYFSIWFLLKVLKQYQGNSSAIIPINNMGIVLFSAIVAWLMFGERLSTVNWVGVVLSIVAISLIAYG